MALLYFAAVLLGLRTQPPNLRSPRCRSKSKASTTCRVTVHLCTGRSRRVAPASEDVSVQAQIAPRSGRRLRVTSVSGASRPSCRAAERVQPIPAPTLRLPHPADRSQREKPPGDRGAGFGACDLQVMSTATPVPDRMPRLSRHIPRTRHRRRRCTRRGQCGGVPGRLGHGSGHGLEEGSHSCGDSAHTRLLSERSHGDERNPRPCTNAPRSPTSWSNCPGAYPAPLPFAPLQGTGCQFEMARATSQLVLRCPREKKPDDLSRSTRWVRSSNNTQEPRTRIPQNSIAPLCE